MNPILLLEYVAFICSYIQLLFLTANSTASSTLLPNTPNISNVVSTRYLRLSILLSYAGLHEESQDVSYEPALK